MKRLAALTALSISLLVASNASASPNFPDVVKSTLSLSYLPPCTLCHEGGRTGAGTVTTPFGRAMRDRGAVSGDTGSVAAALTKLGADKVDSDGDGTTDVDELKRGTDPSSKGGASLDTPEIGYGCGAQVAGRGAHGETSWIVLALFSTVLLARRRRKVLRALPVAAVIAFIGCYDISYVSTDKCSSGAMWTGISDSGLMKPGAACLECHGRGRGERFTAAGTIYTKIDDPNDCVGTTVARVIITGADKRSIELTPNEAGNFYTSLPIAMPYTAKLISGGKVVEMTAAQTTGDCNSCHTQHGANDATGRILPP